MTECIHGLTPETCSICLHGVTPREEVEIGPKIAHCQSCDARIFWGVNPRTGKRNPIDADPVQGGNISLIGYDAEDVPQLAYGARGSGPYVSHFSTCPESRDWKRSR